MIAQYLETEVKLTRNCIAFDSFIRALLDSKQEPPLPLLKKKVREG